MSALLRNALTAASVGALALLGACASTSTPPPAAAAATAPAASAEPAMPDPKCLALLDELTAEVPKDESLTYWRSKGLRLSRPLLLLKDTAKDFKEHSGVIVRMKVGEKGTVLPGSVQVVRSVGDKRLAEAMPTATQGIQFDYSGMFKPPSAFTFTTSYIACADQ